MHEETSERTLQEDYEVEVMQGKDNESSDRYDAKDEVQLRESNQSISNMDKRNLKKKFEKLERNFKEFPYLQMIPAKIE